jgi:hypothetical protein
MLPKYAFYPYIQQEEVHINCFYGQYKKFSTISRKLHNKLILNIHLKTAVHLYNMHTEL